jgi:hypothetical protein
MSTTKVNNSVTTITGKRANVVESELNDYESIYKVDFNFDADISNMNPEVLSEYINRVLGNHPYYIDVTNIIDIVVNDETNKVTIIVSSKEVGERLQEIDNNVIGINEVIEDDIDSNIYNYNNTNNKDLKLINQLYPKNQKYILEYETPEGKAKLYEYDFGGFNKAKSLYYDKHIVLNENKKRHFLRNTNDNPYYYDEYMNSEINYVDNVNGNNVNPNNPVNVKHLVNETPDLINMNLNNLNTINNSLPSMASSNEGIPSIASSNEGIPSMASSNNYLTTMSANDVNDVNDVNDELIIDEGLAKINELEGQLKKLENNNLNNVNNVNVNMNNAPKYLNYFIIFLILICVLAILFIVFNYIFRNTTPNVNNVNNLI